MELWEGVSQITRLMHDYRVARHVPAIDQGYELYLYASSVLSSSIGTKGDNSYICGRVLWFLVMKWLIACMYFV
jgi:hypothetical protein